MRGYRGPEYDVKSTPPDQILLFLGPGDVAKALLLSAPTTQTGQRLRRFCRNLLETPSVMRFDDGA
jgi:hypothetical protein